MNDFLRPHSGMEEMRQLQPVLRIYGRVQHRVKILVADARRRILPSLATTGAELSIYGLRRPQPHDPRVLETMNGQQEGDPAKLAAALVQIIVQEDPPVRWVAAPMQSTASSRRRAT